MAERPPDEPTVPWDEIAKQVQSALEELNLDSPETQSRLMGDLQSMMSSLDGLGLPVDLTPPNPAPPSPPDISVVEGGLEEAATRESSETRPDLKVAPEPEPTEGEERSLEDSADALSGDKSFRWFSLGDLAGKGAPTSPSSPLAKAGRIQLTGADAESGVQTVFQGTTAATYRINAQTGSLRILLDGKSADVVSPGQSMDVEGTLIRVVLEQAESAEGSYERVS